MILIAYIIGKMFYLSASGLPQPADLALAVLAPFFIRPTYLRSTMSTVRPYAVFLGLVFLINLIWFGVSQSAEFVQTITFYAFNAIVFIFVLSVIGQHGTSIERPVSIGLFIALAIQIFVVITHVGETARLSGTFLNPNQLGYWALCILGIFYLVRQSRAGLFEIAFTIGTLYIAYVSLSRSTILAIAFLAIVHFLRHAPRRTFGVLAVGVVAASLLIILPGPIQRGIETRFQQMEALEKLEGRFARASEKSQFEARGYDRVAENPTLIITGAGEGFHERFSDVGRELHSTPGTVLFSYGLLGAVTFLIFLGSLANYTKIISYLYLAPFILYGLAHQGLRFSFFWIFCALLAASSRGMLSAGFNLGVLVRTRFRTGSFGARTIARPPLVKRYLRRF